MVSSAIVCCLEMSFVVCCLCPHGPFLPGAYPRHTVCTFFDGIVCLGDEAGSSIVKETRRARDGFLYHYDEFRECYGCAADIRWEEARIRGQFDDDEHVRVYSTIMNLEPVHLLYVRHLLYNPLWERVLSVRCVQLSGDEVVVVCVHPFSVGALRREAGLWALVPAEFIMLSFDGEVLDPDDDHVNVHDIPGMQHAYHASPEGPVFHVVVFYPNIVVLARL